MGKGPHENFGSALLSVVQCFVNWFYNGFKLMTETPPEIERREREEISGR